MAARKAQEQQVRAGGYLRISSDPKDKRQGVARQREDVAALCEVKGWQVVEFYEDNDCSASNGKDREHWDRLLADVKAGKIDAIAAWDQDRGWRMMSELEQLRKFFAGLGRQVPLATTGQGDIDLYSPTGILAAQIKTAVSEHEISMMKVRQKRAGRQRAEQGRPKWKRAFGYVTDTRPKEKDDGTRQLDPVTAPLVVEGYRAIVAGASLKDVATMWNDAQAYGRAGKPWNESLVSQFLRKPRNAALREYDGEIIGKATWPPLVDESLWKAAQAALDSRPAGGRGKRRTMRRHLLSSGMLWCGKEDCGGYLNARHGGGDRGIVYVCATCHGVSIRAVDVEPLIIGLVAGRLAKPDAVDLLKGQAHDEARAQAIRDEKAELYGELKQLAVERANRLLTGEQVRIATEIIEGQLKALEDSEIDQERLRVFDGIPLGRPEAVEAVADLTADRFRAVMSVLMKATVVPVGKGSHLFDPERVQIAWLGE